MEQAGVRWAFDEQHRAPYGLDGYVQNTWRFGLDRVLAGVAMSDDAERWIGTTLPLDDVGSRPASTSPVGWRSWSTGCSTSPTGSPAATRSSTGSTRCATGIESLTAVARGDEWQTGQVQRELAGLSDDAARQGPSSSCACPTCAR